MKESPLETKQEKLRQLEQLCRRQGLPLTAQRRLIFSALLDHKDHPTADEIFLEVQGRLPGISRTTVYRVLETLVRLGVARKVSHPGAAARFDPNLTRHHHLVCLGCQSMVDFVDPGLDRLPLSALHRAGFEVTDYSVYFQGLCACCQKKKAGPAPRPSRGRKAQRKLHPALEKTGP